MLKPFWKKHFALKQFFPFYENPSAFITCQWQTDKNEPNIKYLTYRIAIAILFFVTWIISITKETVVEKWPIFLTNWGYTVCTLQATISLFMLSSSALAPKIKTMPNLRDQVLRAYPAYWILNTVATPLAFGITFMYWVVIYDAKIMVFDAMNYFVHGNNSVLMMIDLWMVSHPIRILHWIYPTIFAISYTVFSVIYYAAGGTSKDGTKCIYKILNWDKPLNTTLICLGVTVFVICLHFIAFGLYKIRQKINDSCCSKKHDISSSKSELKRNSTVSNDLPV